MKKKEENLSIIREERNFDMSEFCQNGAHGDFHFTETRRIVRLFSPDDTREYTRTESDTYIHETLTTKKVRKE